MCGGSWIHECADGVVPMHCVQNDGVSSRGSAILVVVVVESQTQAEACSVTNLSTEILVATGVCVSERMRVAERWGTRWEGDSASANAD